MVLALKQKSQKALHLDEVAQAVSGGRKLNRKKARERRERRSRESGSPGVRESDSKSREFSSQEKPMEATDTRPLVRSRSIPEMARLCRRMCNQDLKEAMNSDEFGWIWMNSAFRHLPGFGGVHRHLLQFGRDGRGGQGLGRRLETRPAACPNSRKHARMS